MKIPSLIAGLLIVACSQAAAAEDGPPPLRNNPFSRPPSDVVIDDRISGRSEEVPNSTIELQATMVGSTRRLANVDGRIVEIGDVVNGHEVVEILERSAVFERNGTRNTVYVKPLLAEEGLAERDE